MENAMELLEFNAAMENSAPRPYSLEDREWVIDLGMSERIPQQLMEGLLNNSEIEKNMVVVPKVCCLIFGYTDDGKPEKILAIGTPEVVPLIRYVLQFVGREDIELQSCHCFPDATPTSGATH